LPAKEVPRLGEFAHDESRREMRRFMGRLLKKMFVFVSSVEWCVCVSAIDYGDGDGNLSKKTKILFSWLNAAGVPEEGCLYYESN
jgi:hypothetical protein